MRCIVFYMILLTFIIISLSIKRSGLRRIIGGRDADEEEYQYIVRLQHQILIVEVVILVGYRHFCTGAVLTPTWTLTAAHCLALKDSIKIGNITVTPVLRYGESKNSTISEVLYTIEHPSYKLRIFDLHNDIGLIKTEPIALKQYGRVSALDFVTMVGQEAILTGYGVTNSSEGFVSDATTLGKPLQMLDVVIVQCDKKNLNMKPGMCVARRCGQSSGICPGDSGGPMLHPSGVVGVNSIGSKDLVKFCSLESSSPVYDIGVITPTSPYIDWISATIQKDVAFPNTIP